MHFLSSDNGQEKQPYPLGYAAGKAGKMIWASVGVGCSCIARPIAHLQFLYRWRCTPKSPLESYFLYSLCMLIVQKFILLNLYCQTFFIKPQLAIATLRLHASMSSMMSICLSICLSVCLSVAKMQKNAFFNFFGCSLGPDLRQFWSKTLFSGKLVPNPICVPNLKLLALTVAKIRRGSQIFLGCSPGPDTKQIRIDILLNVNSKI